MFLDFKYLLYFCVRNAGFIEKSIAAYIGNVSGARCLGKRKKIGTKTVHHL